jgi:LPXTG-motif cell wall-anchored protein
MPDGSLAAADTVAVENENFLSMIDGEPVMIKDLPVRQKVNVYLGDAYWSLPAPEPMAVAEPEPEPEPMAEPEPEPEPEPVMLPKTAGQLPWLAVIGGLFLLLGGALRFARK